MRLLENGQFDDLAASHCRCMRADSCAGPVRRLVHVREGRSIFEDTGNEFIYKMWMRAPVAPALGKGGMSVRFIVNTLCREPLDRLRKQMREIRHGYSFRAFAGVDDGLFVFDTSPLKSLF